MKSARASYEDFSFKRLLLTAETIFGAVLIVISALLLTSCRSDAADAGKTDAVNDYPATPAGVVEAFYQTINNKDCTAAIRFLSFDGYQYENDEIELFIDAAASSDDIQKLGDEIRGMAEVESVVFISKEEALERLRERLNENADVLGPVSGNPLPNSYEITVKDPADVEQVASRFFNNPLVDSTPGRFPPDGIKYSAGADKSMMNGAEKICNSVTSQSDYQVTDFKVVDESVDENKARVKFTAVASINSIENTPDEFTFVLLRSDGTWKVDALKSLSSINGYSGFFSLMLINNKAMGQTIDTSKLGQSSQETQTASDIGAGE